MYNSEQRAKIAHAVSEVEIIEMVEALFDDPFSFSRFRL